MRARMGPDQAESSAFRAAEGRFRDGMSPALEPARSVRLTPKPRGDVLPGAHHEQSVVGFFSSRCFLRRRSRLRPRRGVLVVERPQSRPEPDRLQRRLQRGSPMLGRQPAVVQRQVHVESRRRQQLRERGEIVQRLHDDEDGVHRPSRLWKQLPERGHRIARPSARRRKPTVAGRKCRAATVYRARAPLS